MSYFPFSRSFARSTPRFDRLIGTRGSGAISRGQAIRDSYQVLRNVAPYLSNPAIKIALALVLGESGYGILLKSGFTEPDGTPTHNWGAIKRAGDAGCFYHGDSDEAVPVCFARNSSAEAGAKQFLKTWGSTDTIAAAQAGDVYGVAKAMRGHGYYTGFDCTRTAEQPWGIVLCPKGVPDRTHVKPCPKGGAPKCCAEATEANIDCAIKQYAQMIANGVKEVSAALGQPNDDTHIDYPKSSLVSSRTGQIVVAAAGLGLAYWLTMGSGYKYTRSVLPLEGSV